MLTELPDPPTFKGVEIRRCHGFPEYAIGSDGTPWSSKSGQWKRMRGSRAKKSGYRYVTLQIGGSKFVARYVHTLVLEAFVCQRPDGMEACHAPGVTADKCSLDVLRWDTHQENLIDAAKDGKSSRVLTPELVREIRAARGKERQTATASRLGIHQTLVSRVQLGQCYGYIK